MVGRLSLVRKIRQGVGPLEKESVYGEMSHRGSARCCGSKDDPCDLSSSVPVPWKEPGVGRQEPRGQRVVLRVSFTFS